MKKQDLIIVAALFAILMAWPFLYSSFIEPRLAPRTKQTAQIDAAPATSQAPGSVKSTPEPALITAPAESIPAISPKEQCAIDETPARMVTLTNGGLSVVVSTRGGGIVSATLGNYRASVDKNSGPVCLDFTSLPGLAYSGLEGFSADTGFMVISSRPAAVVLERSDTNGVKLVRFIELNNLYQVVVRDSFTNGASRAVTLPKHAVQVGSMSMPAGDFSMSGMDYLGIDALAASGGEGITHWAGKLAKMFKGVMKETKQPYLSKNVSKDEDTPVDWVAVKNKFFTQILVPDGGAAGYRLFAERVTVDGEDTNPALKPKSAVIRSVAASVLMAETKLGAGETSSQSYKLYLGPKKFSILRNLGFHQEDVMEFGMWSPVCKLLLTVLNYTYTFIPNYGVAIILLTILIRIIFWPLTHKGTESMKKMQGLQPLMAELKVKYKGNARKIQEETMALYKKNKVNPMSGCLPMLIQIPVFIALFVVLRSAIELRFAPFLWVQDLSAPERLFADILPIPLNILPIFMAVSQAWQQTLMPATDPNQQKMMLFFMPVMMMVMFYMMPSALVLYWSANQCIVIIQQLIQQKRTAPAGTKK